MAAKKRRPAQRDLDAQWIVEQADRDGLSPHRILQRAKTPVDPEDFGHIDEAERAKAIDYETRRRASVARVSRQQVQYDLMKMRRRALDEGDTRYRKIYERTIEELARLAFSDLRQILRWGPDGTEIYDSLDLDEVAAATVSGITVKTTIVGEEMSTEIKLDTHSKNQALRDLLRHLGGYMTIKLPTEAEDPDAVVDKLLERLSEPAPDADPEESGSGED